MCFFVNTDSESDLLRENLTGDKKINNLESGVSGLIDLRKEFPNNSMIGRLKIDSLGNKINYLREVFLKCPFDMVCIDETKIDPSFPNGQFHIDGYQFPPFRVDRNKKCKGKIVFVREVIIAKRMNELESKTSEIICIELTFSKKKWLVVFANRPPRNTNKHTFFDELSISLVQITNTYENFIVTGDLNIDKLDDSRDTFFLKNLSLEKTCFKADSGTSIDVMLTNRRRSFQKTAIIETGLSDHHKLTVSFFRTHFARLSPKNIEYRNYKKFDSKSFLYELD